MKILWWTSRDSKPYFGFSLKSSSERVSTSVHNAEKSVKQRNSSTKKIVRICCCNGTRLKIHVCGCEPLFFYFGTSVATLGKELPPGNLPETRNRPGNWRLWLSVHVLEEAFSYLSMQFFLYKQDMIYVRQIIYIGYSKIEDIFEFKLFQIHAYIGNEFETKCYLPSVGVVFKNYIVWSWFNF